MDWGAERLDGDETTDVETEGLDEETEDSETESLSTESSVTFEHIPMSGGTFNPQSPVFYDPLTGKAKVLHSHQFYSTWAPTKNPRMREVCVSRVKDCMDWQRDMGQKLGFSEEEIEKMQSKDQAELFALQEL